MVCPNCSKAIRTANGMAFHLTWCKPAEPKADPLPAVVELRQRIEPPTFARMYGPDLAELVTEPISEPVTFSPTMTTLYAARTPKAEPVKAVKARKLPAVAAGKHQRCVAHEPVTRHAPGAAYMCFDTMPDADAIAERRRFVAELDVSWNAHHAAEIARPTGDGLVTFRYALTTEDARADCWIEERVPGWRAGFNANVPTRGRKAPKVFVRSRSGSVTPDELAVAA